MNNEIDQEYVNKNIDEIIEFMKMCEPEKARKNSRSWRHTLLKDYKPKIHIIVCYQNYTECENMKNQWEKRCDEFYEREQELNYREKELDEKAMHNEHWIKKMEEHEKTWRIITQQLSSKLRNYMSDFEYMGFVDQFPPYYM